jgi:hypothetical protein
MREKQREAQRGAKEADAIAVKKVQRIMQTAQRCKTQGKSRGGSKDG